MKSAMQFCVMATAAAKRVSILWTMQDAFNSHAGNFWRIKAAPRHAANRPDLPPLLPEKIAKANISRTAKTSWVLEYGVDNYQSLTTVCLLRSGIRLHRLSQRNQSI